MSFFVLCYENRYCWPIVRSTRNRPALDCSSRNCTFVCSRMQKFDRVVDLVRWRPLLAGVELVGPGWRGGGRTLVGWHVRWLAIVRRRSRNQAPDAFISDNRSDSPCFPQSNPAVDVRWRSAFPKIKIRTAKQKYGVRSIIRHLARSSPVAVGAHIL